MSPAPGMPTAPGMPGAGRAQPPMPGIAGAAPGGLPPDPSVQPVPGAQTPSGFARYGSSRRGGALPKGLMKEKKTNFLPWIVVVVLVLVALVVLFYFMRGGGEEGRLQPPENVPVAEFFT